MPNQANGEAVQSHSTLVSGSDGTNGIPLKVAADGAVAVDIESTVPGTGATNLGKARAGTAGATDTGVMALGVNFDDSTYVPMKFRGLTDALTTASVGGIQWVFSILGCWNGSTYDRVRNNVDVTLLASAERTTTQTSADITTYNATQLTVILDQTTNGTGDITLTINGKDPASGKYYLLLAGTNITSTSTNVYRVGIGNTVTANVSANVMLPRVIQIVVTANNANPETYSVGYSLSV